MILIGLMSGGDYQQGGLARCGVTTAHALARCGFGDSLFEAAMSLDRTSLEDLLGFLEGRSTR
jgi:Holliday junction resolvase YEN1